MRSQSALIFVIKISTCRQACGIPIMLALASAETNRSFSISKRNIYASGAFDAAIIASADLYRPK